MKKYVQLTLVLFIISALSGLIISGVNSFTSPIIEKNRYEKTKKVVKQFFEEMDDFTDASEIEEYHFKSDETFLDLYEVKDEEDKVIGFVFLINAPSSYSGTLETLVGIDTKGKITGIGYGKMNETAKTGTKVKDDPKFVEQFIGKTKIDKDEVKVITGASKSSEAVIEAVRLVQAYYAANLSK